MSVIATAVKHLIAAGVTGDALVTAIAEMENAMQPARSSGAERTARWRSKKESERHSDVTTVTGDADPSPPLPPFPPAPPNPPITPLTRTHSARECAISAEETLAFDAYNDIASELGLSKAQALTPERKTKIRQRLNECGGLTGWLDALGKIRGSPFLCGDNDRGWKANLDFLLQKASFTRLMEGSYDRQKPQRPTTSAKPTLRDGFAILDAVTDEAIRRANGRGAEGSEEDSFSLPGLRKSAA